MKTKLQNVYQCEHCNRKMLGAGAMSRHEKYCSVNPNNMHKCFQYCAHLVKNKIIIHSQYDGFHGEPLYALTEFTCNITNNKMFSYKAAKYPDINTSGLIRMPLNCNDYCAMDGISILGSIANQSKS